MRLLKGICFERIAVKFSLIQVQQLKLKLVLVATVAVSAVSSGGRSEQCRKLVCMIMEGRGGVQKASN